MVGAARKIIERRRCPARLVGILYGHMLPKRGQLFTTAAARLPKLSLRSSIVHLSIDTVIEIPPSSEKGGRTKRFGGIVEKEERMLPGEDYLSR